MQKSPVATLNANTGQVPAGDTDPENENDASGESDFENSDVECNIDNPDNTTSEMDEEIRNEQRNDTGWNRIIAYLTGRNSKADKRLLSVAAKFTMKRGLLYRVVRGEGSSKLALVVPSKLRPLVLHNAHDARISGHQGILRTFRRIQGRYYWNSMLKDVSDYVGSCVTCAMMKGSKLKQMGEMQLMPISERPFRRIAIDKFGPIQNSDTGHKYVILAIDTCTRYVMAKAVRDAKAETAAKFMKRIILDYYPLEVLSDNGSEFAAEFETLLQYAGIKHFRSASRHPKTNGMVERANQTISQIMRTLIVEKKHEDWVRALPYAVSSYNSAVNEVTGFSPRFLLYGVEVHVENLLHESRVETETRNEISVADARKLAAERTRKQQLKDKKRHDRKRRAIRISAGDLVMVETELSQPGQSKKFNQRRKGPFVVIETRNNNTLRIQDQHGAETVINIERCIRIKPRPEYLEYNDGVNKTIDETVRGPDAGEEGGEPPEHEINTETDMGGDMDDNMAGEMDELNEMVPVRKSTRRRNKPERLIEVMNVSMLFEGK